MCVCVCVCERERERERERGISSDSLPSVFCGLVLVVCANEGSETLLTHLQVNSGFGAHSEALACFTKHIQRFKLPIKDTSFPRLSSALPPSLLSSSWRPLFPKICRRAITHNHSPHPKPALRVSNFDHRRHSRDKFDQLEYASDAKDAKDLDNADSPCIIGR